MQHVNSNTKCSYYKLQLIHAQYIILKWLIAVT